MSAANDESSREAATSTDELGAWEVGPGDTSYSLRNFWTVRRRNPAKKGWHRGWETLLSKAGHQHRRFYSEDAAHKEAAKLNASN